MANECDNATKLAEITIQESKFETIDGAILDWIRNRNIHVQTKEGFKKVPVIWASSERAFQTKNYDDLRDESGTMIFPVISVQRATVEKSLTKRIGRPGMFSVDSDHKGGAVMNARKINQSKTRNFANADGSTLRGVFKPLRCNTKVVYDTYTIPLPVYINVTYKVIFRAEYQQQINTMITPFITYTGGINEFTIKKDGHRYPAFVAEQFGVEDNVTDFTEEERKFQVNLDIRVLGYVMGSGDNQSPPKIVRRESVAELRMPRERTLYGSLGDYEQTFGYAAMVAASCCPALSPPSPRAFGSNLGAPSEGGAITNVTIIQGIVDDRVADIIVVKDFLGNVGNSAGVGNGNLHFPTSTSFKANSDTLFWNGLLQHPGPQNDYIVWDGSEAHLGRAAYSGITIVDQSGNDPDWAPPQTGAEKGDIITGDDILLMSYIKA